LDPRRPDPFELFAAYPTEALQRGHRVAIAPGLTWAQAKVMLSHDLATMMQTFLPSLEEAEQVFEALSAAGTLTAGELGARFGPRAGVIERGLLWMAKFGVLTLVGRPELPVETELQSAQETPA
ncbi:MAG TPA: hypothetical protein VIO94_01490, partial [Phenylobacterium sp.]